MPRTCRCSSGWRETSSPSSARRCSRRSTTLSAIAPARPSLFDFDFRIEIYTPQHKRQYGYYVLPILHGDRLIGRVDPKMDREHGRLHIHAVHAEKHAPLDRRTARSIRAAIEELAAFLGASEIRYTRLVPPGWRRDLLG